MDSVRPGNESGPSAKSDRLPLPNFAATWDGLSALDQWLVAVTGQVGPPPVLGPGVITEIALVVLLGTLGYPSAA